jgi:hypothetical protein
MDNGGIEIDLFQINQVIKNEIGKDQDMIETYFLESLKSIYMTIVQYLQSVPQNEPDFMQTDDILDVTEAD